MKSGAKTKEEICREAITEQQNTNAGVASFEIVGEKSFNWDHYWSQQLQEHAVKHMASWKLARAWGAYAKPIRTPSTTTKIIPLRIPSCRRFPYSMHAVVSAETKLFCYYTWSQMPH